MHPNVAVIGLGMVSPVGRNAPQTCAALRAGISQFQEVEGIVDRFGEPVIASQIGSLAGARDSMASAAIRACAEAIAPVDRAEFARRSISVSVLLRDNQLPGKHFEATEFGTVLLSGLGLSQSTPVYPYDRGNAAGMDALFYAHQRLARNQNSLELIVGFDSLLDLPTLARFETMNRLKSPSQGRGLVPGEAVASVLFQSVEAPSNLPAYCTIEGVGCAIEQVPVGSEYPCLGEGLTTAISAALELAGWASGDVGKVYCDLNGEVYRAHEWMLALCRTLTNPKIVHPADCIGDIGAAFAPLLIGMAAVALDRGYARTDRALVFCSSECGNRGSVCLSRPSKGLRAWK
jgi:3-oxoacyl-[acyl-carrier-protein] synthase I